MLERLSRSKGGAPGRNFPDDLPHRARNVHGNVTLARFTRAFVENAGENAERAFAKFILSAAGESPGCPRRKRRRPRQGRLGAISELTAAASGCGSEGGANDPDDFIEHQAGIIATVA